MACARAFFAIAALLVLAGCWTVPGAGPQRSGHNPAETALTATNVATLSPDWTWQAEWTTPRAVLDPVTSPAGVHISVGHKLVTIDPATGTERWRAVLYDAGVASQLGISAGTPAVDDGNVLVSVLVPTNIAPGGPRGTHAYDAETGNHSGVVARDAIGGAVPRDGRVIATFREAIGSGISVTGYAVTDLDDGAQSWSAHLGLNPPGNPSSPAVASDRFFITDGSTVFAYPLTEPVGCYLPFPSSPFRVCPPTWSTTFESGLTRPTLSRDGQLLLLGEDGHLWALQASSGGVVWSGPLPTSDPPSAAPSVDDDHVFVPTAGKLVVFDRQGCGGAACNPVWSADTGGTVSAQPAVAGGVVYTATRGRGVARVPGRGLRDGYLRAAVGTRPGRTRHRCTGGIARSPVRGHRRRTPGLVQPARYGRATISTRTWTVGSTLSISIFGGSIP